MDEVCFYGSTLTASQVGLLALNKLELVQAIRKFEPLIQSEWTAASWAAAKAAYDTAVLVLNEDYPLQSTIDAATADLLAAIDALEIAITYLKIDAPATSPVTRGKTYSFEVTLNAGASDDKVIWSVNNPVYATVDNNGNVTILNKTGTVILTATDPVGGLSYSIILRIT